MPGACRLSIGDGTKHTQHRMTIEMKLAQYSMGIGDRFGHQGQAQLAAFVRAAQQGLHVVPVWNKSNREHLIVHSQPAAVRQEADAAVQALHWSGGYHVDADHIGLKTVDRFLGVSDFFTIDVADFIAEPAAADAVDALIASMAAIGERPAIAGLTQPLLLTPQRIAEIAGKYLVAVQEAGRVYRHIEKHKGRGNFITEVSMDETDRSQTPVDLLVILAALAQEGIPVQTIAPKFTGRFNKGVDYQGDLRQFEQEFNDDLAVVAFAVQHFRLPADLKLSVHSGSDKFSIYEPIRRALGLWHAGLHLKTAGTTWLEEIAALAAAGDDGLSLARDIYAAALARFDELCGPYASVIDIDRAALPGGPQVQAWTGTRFAAAIRHDPADSRYNPSLRQLLHVGYKLAAEAGERYTRLLDKYASAVGAEVTANLFTRHLLRIFPAAESHQDHGGHRG